MEPLLSGFVNDIIIDGRKHNLEPTWRHFLIKCTWDVVIVHVSQIKISSMFKSLTSAGAVGKLLG